jgi:hypothetical protein
MVVTGDFGYGGSCEQEVGVRGTYPLRLFRDTCGQIPPNSEVEGVTVDDLLWVVREQLGQNGNCGPNGCGCDGRIRVRVDFDSAWGYPRRRQVALDTLDPLYRSLRNKSVAVGGGCTDMGLVFHQFEVTHLEPWMSMEP